MEALVGAFNQKKAPSPWLRTFAWTFVSSCTRVCRCPGRRSVLLLLHDDSLTTRWRWRLLAAAASCAASQLTRDSPLPPLRPAEARGRPATRLWAQATVHNKILNVLWDFYNILCLTKYFWHDEYSRICTPKYIFRKNLWITPLTTSKIALNFDKFWASDRSEYFLW